MQFRRFHIHPSVIAHRGASLRAPENTMAAFRAARDDGALWIETDVKLTADGVPVLFHDETLDRTTDGHGPIADIGWDALARLDAGKGFGPAFAGTRVPRLADLLPFAAQAHIRLNLELLPCPGRARATAMVALIEAARLWPETALPPLISSFDPDCLTIAAGLHPDWPRGLLLEDWRDDWRAVAESVDAASIHCNADWLTPARIEAFRDADLTVLAYTVNDTDRARALIEAGVEAVFTDDPARMVRDL